MSRKNLDPEKYFVLVNGIVLKDLKDLAMVLDELSIEEYNFHVNDEKNDFSSWARDVFFEDTLAEKISNSKNQKDLQIMLFKHIIK